jgi:Cd2+/Zn2+-exporting ATPase
VSKAKHVRIHVIMNQIQIQIQNLVVLTFLCVFINELVTYVAGLAATAQRGILVKGGIHLEALGLVKKIAFDKTGA